MSIVSLQNVLFHYPEFSLNVTVALDEPSVTGIFGPSGSGKTTLLEIIAGIRKPQAGKVIIGGTTFYDSGNGVYLAPELRRTGYVPQDLALFPHLTVRENIAYSRRDGNPDVIQALELMPLMDRKIHQLSGGEKQRVAFARALQSDPGILLLDEPFANLDRELKNRMYEFIIPLLETIRIPVLWVSHDPDEIVRLCSSVIFLREGKVDAYRKTSEAFEVDPALHYKPKPDNSTASM